MKFSAVLLNWKRPHNLDAILASLFAVPRIEQVIIWDNSGNLGPYPDSRVRVCSSSRNICTLGRFKAIAHASCENIYTQDDDVVVDDIESILDLYENRPASIVASLTRGHMAAEAGKKPWLQLGWGSAFSALAPDVLQYWVDVYGEDELLERKADRVFTILHGKHVYRAANITPLKDLNGGRSECSRDALYRRPDHVALTDKATRLAMEIRGARA